MQHTADCKYKTPEALAQSIALSLRDEDYTCTNNYLPGMADVFQMESTNEADTAVATFGTKADHLLVAALKRELTDIRGQVAANGGDITKLKLLEVTQSEKQAVTHIIMRLSAGKQQFTLQPVGLFNNEGNWYILGSKFTVVFE